MKNPKISTWSQIRKYFLGIILLIVQNSLPGSGTVVVDSLYSTILNETRYFSVYLPDGYEFEPDVTYPVVYYLHGFGGNYTSRPEIYDVLDKLISTQQTVKMICVKPDGYTEPYRGSMYTNSELNGNFEDYIIQEVIPYAESKYRIKNERRFRGLSGRSMGGYGTMALGMKHSNLFSSLTAHSGPLSFINFENITGVIIGELDNNPNGVFDPDNGMVTSMMFGAAGAFSPNPDSPLKVDLPIDYSGNFIDSVFNKWFEFDPYTMVDNYINELKTLTIYFECGIADELGFYDHNVHFSDKLDSLNIPHQFTSYLGTHGSKREERFMISFKKHSDHFLANAAPEDSLVYHEMQDLRIISNYPNPVLDHTTIQYTTPYEGNVRLFLYNINGHLIDTIVSGYQPAGTQNITWSPDGKYFPSGIYILGLYLKQSGKLGKLRWTSKKIVILK